MEATQHAKINKSNFEQKLSILQAGIQLYKEKHYERSFDKNDEEQFTLLWLYYNDVGHIGTWHKQGCWVFESNFLKR